MKSIIVVLIEVLILYTWIIVGARVGAIGIVAWNAPIGRGKSWLGTLLLYPRLLERLTAAIAIAMLWMLTPIAIGTVLGVSTWGGCWMIRWGFGRILFGGWCRLSAEMKAAPSQT